MAEENGLVMEIAQQQEDRVLFSVPMIGFPHGYKLRPGDRVVLVHEENGPAVRPLVHSFTTDAVIERTGDTLRVGDQNFTMQESTIVDDEAFEGGRSESYDVFIVDHGSAEGEEQIIAVRPTPEPL